MAKGFFSPKLTLHVGDGFEFMKQNQDAFDVIITDSSDPVGKCHFYVLTPFFASRHRKQCCSQFFFVLFFAGPAESLFKESYYQLMKAALRSTGILCSQGNFSTFSIKRRISNFSEACSWVEVLTLLLNYNFSPFQAHQKILFSWLSVTPLEMLCSHL